MNNYQRVAIFLTRIAGALIASTTVIGLALTERHSIRWWDSIIWFIVGVLLIFLSKPIGEWLGSGLDSCQSPTEDGDTTGD
jgi:hypothetical protein